MRNAMLLYVRKKQYLYPQGGRWYAPSPPATRRPPTPPQKKLVIKVLGKFLLFLFHIICVDSLKPRTLALGAAVPVLASLSLSHLCSYSSLPPSPQTAGPGTLLALLPTSACLLDLPHSWLSAPGLNSISSGPSYTQTWDGSCQGPDCEVPLIILGLGGGGIFAFSLWVSWLLVF